MLPGDVKPPEGGTERRRQRAPRAPFNAHAVNCVLWMEWSLLLGVLPGAGGYFRESETLRQQNHFERTFVKGVDVMRET